ncbi:MAG: hypothetical protein JWM80_2249 [Cyanobacteria bacterium RYN_339]|nr:hypothetical protein [Cyanobacteria bacterium RYN_339]
MWVTVSGWGAWLWSQVAVDYLHGGPAVLASLGTLAGVFLTAALIELTAVGWTACSLRKLLRPASSARCDLVTALLFQTPVVAHAGVLLSGGLSLWVIRSGALGVRPVWPADTAPWLHVVVVLVAVDLVYYGVHRLQHRWEPLWQLHRFHHAAEEATLLTALRVHPLESALCGVCLAVPLALLGGDGHQGALAFFGTQLLSLLRHSNLPWRWGWFGAYGLVSPAAHRVHHARAAACFDTNFGVLFPWWDHLFGTWRAPTGDLPAIGVAGDALARQGWCAGVWACYADFWRTLGRNARTTWRRRTPTVTLRLPGLLPSSGGTYEP